MHSRTLIAALFGRLVPCALGALASLAHAANDDLLARINSFRDAPQTCNGKQFPAASPLQPSAALDRVKVSAGSALQKALNDAGYAAARAEAVSLSGPRTAAEAMQMLQQNYCATLLSQQYSAAGIAREGERWLVILARPLLSPDLGNSEQAGRKVLALVNAARARPRNCGKRSFAAAAPLAWNSKLADAAQVHSADMANHNYFSHQAKDGGDVGDRARRAGYAWHAIGENIAAGQGSPQQAVSAWLSSSGHCANIMNPAFVEMGAAYVINRSSDATIYWTQVFGRQ